MPGPLMETVTVINKSGKVISTGKQLVNIFQEAKAAYAEKKAQRKELMRAEHQKRLAYKQAQNLIEAREEVQSIASSRHSRRSSRSHRHHKDRAIDSRPPLSHIPERQERYEGSVASSQRSRSSQPRSRRAPSIDGSQYTVPSPEDASTAVARRNADSPAHGGEISRTEPPAHLVHRSASDPDMNLAYGELHQPPSPAYTAVQEFDLEATMTKLDTLLLEAECLHHSATAIIANLQSNPEAMAAVALTLAELSNIIKSMGPTILKTLKTASPAAFALLASPQFLIAGGVALGVTIVMFGGYKIVKQIQANTEAIQANKVEANRMEEPMAYQQLEVGSEISSIENWRRGIADVEEQSVATSVDGELITPMAANQKKERIKERAKEERKHPKAPESLFSIRTSKTSKTSKTHRSKSLRKSKEDSDIRTSTFEPKNIPVRSASSRVAPSEGGRPTRSHRTEKSKESLTMTKDVVVKEEKEEKKKKPSALRNLFNKHKDKHEKDLIAHRPKMLEIAA